MARQTARVGTASVALALLGATPVVAAAPASADGYSIDSTVGDLLDDPRAKAIVDRYLPGISDTDQMKMARGVTLRHFQTYAPGRVSDAALLAIGTDLARLPPR